MADPAVSSDVSPPRAGPAGLGLRHLLSASVGVIVSQITMVSLLQGFGLGGWGFVLALVLALSLALVNAMAFAELALMLPGAGSLSTYAEAALGNFPAILLVFAGYVTPTIFGLPAELILADQILSQAIPTPLPPFAWPVLLLACFVALNVMGTDVFARVQTALSFTVLCFLLVTGLSALSGHVATPQLAGLSSAMSAMGADMVVLSGVALAFWIFVGSEFVTPLTVDAANAPRDLPRAMIGGLLLVFLGELLFGVGAALVLPREQLASSPTPHLDYAMAVFGPGMKTGFAVLALVSTASLLNTLLASIPRMLAAMASRGQVFPVLGYTHPRFDTPVLAILFVAALPLVGLVWSGGDPQAILPLTIAASVAWLLAYMTAQVSLIVLRHQHPELPRPFRLPGYPFLPGLAVAGMGYVIVASASSDGMGAQVWKYTGIVLGVFAAVASVWVRVFMRKGLFERRFLGSKGVQE